ncbi:hypothetical protein A6R68_21705 [Neotoma lepida]|uniref:Alpha-2-HS-glycoprotein n=1 Tax=Neotoma lepida TaxID=56216 RepID=A0A1A6HQU6_NEOLE|nr:hypothetical protein A6R68_21705 [Neotoma lepida]
MKSLALLLCFAQLWGCQSAPHFTGPGFKEVACDDPEVEQAAFVAVDYLNQHLLHGFRHDVNQIDKVKLWFRRPFGVVYELEVDTLETTCHVLDPTPLANCSVRQVAEHAVEGDCDFHVLKQDGKFTVLHAQCHSTPGQMPLQFSTFVEFVVAATDCTAQEATDPAKCNLLAEKQYGFCKASLVKKLGEEEVSVACTIFPKQPQPDSVNTAGPAPAVDQAAPAAPPAGAPASLVVGPMVVAVPPGPPAHRIHHDLRHAFSPVASVESASGEAVGQPNVVQPSTASATGPVVQLCPGRVRHFKI